MPATENAHARSTDPRRRFAMSVDVEDYYQVWAFSDVIERSTWDARPSRVDAATRCVLDLLDRHDAKATFFVLGWVAERAPALVREIVARGHELASHGYDHRKVFDQSPDMFREDVVRTRTILEDIAGVAVTGYRAAGFSIDRRTPWAHEILAEAGHRYSSSSHPIAHDQYGDAGAPRSPRRRDGVIEAPVATAEFLGRRVSCAGGGWFRASPYALSSLLLKKAAASIDGPAIFYFHPWEIDVDQPRIADASAKSRFRHYLNLDRMQEKLERLLGEFHWGRIDEALALEPLRVAAA